MGLLSVCVCCSVSFRPILGAATSYVRGWQCFCFLARYESREEWRGSWSACASPCWAELRWVLSVVVRRELQKYIQQHTPAQCMAQSVRSSGGVSFVLGLSNNWDASCKRLSFDSVLPKV